MSSGGGIDFVPTGETFELDARTHGDRIEISVMNYGNAPDPADIERPMRPFEQGSTAIARTREGAGLGRAIVNLNCQVMAATSASSPTRARACARRQNSWFAPIAELGRISITT